MKQIQIVKPRQTSAQKNRTADLAEQDRRSPSGLMIHKN